MSQELHYTSVARGLKPGARGFCTVASTVGLSPTLAERLEGLSGYRATFPPDHPQSAQNPVAWSHLRINSVGQTVSVVSRIGPAGLDYTDRPNKYAHHVVLDASERHAGGPAWLLEQPGFMVAEWQGPPQQIPTGRRPATGDQPGGVCRAWAKATGDAGWGGAVAEAFLADPKRQVVIIFDPGVDLLPLFVEALALLPADRRWDVTFQTYFTGLPPGVGCVWRGVLRDSAEARQARGNPDALLIDLAEAGHAVGGSLVHWAKTGEAPAATPSSIPHSPERSPSFATPPSPTAASSSRRVTRPTANAQVEPPLHDPYSLGPPPVTATEEKLRDSRKRKPRPAGSPSVWPTVTAAAIAFILGTTFGGAAVYLLLQSRVHANSGRAQIIAETNQPGGPSVIGVTPSPEKNVNLGATSESKPSMGGPKVEKSDKEKKESKVVVKGTIDEPPAKDRKDGKTPKPPAVASASETPPGNENKSVPSGNPSVDGTGNVPSKTTAPLLAANGKGNQSPDVDTKPRTPWSETEPIPMNTWVIAADPGNENPQFIAAHNVKSLSLFGGDDDRWGNYRSDRKPDNGKRKLEVLGKTTGGEELGPIGVFSWEGDTVKFKWDEKSHTKQLKESFQYCILAVEFEAQQSEYRLLRQPKFLEPAKQNKQLSKPKALIVDWLEKSYDDDWKSGARRIPKLYSLTLDSPESKSVRFLRSSPSKDPKDHPSLITDDGLLEAKLTATEPPQISVTMKTSSTLLSKDVYLDRKNRQAFLTNSPSEYRNNFQQELNDITKSLTNDDHLRKRFEDFARSSIEATIVIETGGKRFLLATPKLERHR